MMRNTSWIWIICVLFVSGGATCYRRDVVVPFPPPPAVFEATPTLEQLIEVVNRTDAVREMATNTASVEVLNMPSLPKLNATVALQRDRNFRMRANLPVILGAGIDLGSNNELFWFEVPEGMSKTLYFARHDQYRQMMSRSILPVDPTWIMSGLGLVHLDPAQVTSGPVQRADGKLEIRTMATLPDGVYQSIYYIEPSAGYVTDQFLIAPDQRIVATSNATNHRYYAEQNCALPHRVQLQLTPSTGPPMELRVDIGTYAINQLLSSDPQQFAMPQGASQTLDLTLIGNVAPPVAAPSYYSASRDVANPIRGTER